MPKHFRASRAELKDFRGKRIHGAFFSLSYSPTLRGPKAAVSVSKKVASNAVDRNRIRRRAKAALLPLLTETQLPLMILLQAKNKAITAAYEEIRKDIQDLIRAAQK